MVRVLARARWATTASLTGVLAGLLSLAMAISVQARQEPQLNPPFLSFEVASVRQQEQPVFRRPVIAALPGGSFQAVNATVRDLVSYAYGLGSHDRIEGGPAWVSTDRFDINAKAPRDWPSIDAAAETARPMVQQLLADRFGLRVTHSKGARSGYALLLARADGRLGPRVSESKLNCTRLLQDRRARIAAGDDPNAPENRSEECNVAGENQRTRFSGHTMATLALFLSNNMREIVIDRTGLAGHYVMELTAAPGYVPPNARAEMLARGIEFTEPPLEVALREQLGLKLEKTTVEIEVVRIDHVDRPSAN
jgi:uncharacterized protein (TIGR03435 family)